MELRNVILLAFCLSLGVTGNIVVFSVSALGAMSIADDPALATFPFFLQYLFATLSTIPASYIMKRFGWKKGFMAALTCSSTGGIVAFLGLSWSNFYLFCLGSGMIGVMVGFAPYYRFAAVDGASQRYKSKAISLVMAGGVLAAVAGPFLANHTVLLSKTPYGGPYLLLIFLPLISLLILNFMRFESKPAGQPEKGRSVKKILKQPKLVMALLGSLMSYMIMALLMVVIPLEMKSQALSFASITQVVQWHVLGMFAPSFITGHLIQRFGVYRVMYLGFFFDLICVLFHFSGTNFEHYLVSMIFLGIGWNFTYISASSLLTETYRESERASVQALNEFSVLVTQSFCAMTSGLLYFTVGWLGLNAVVLGLILVAGLMGLWLINNQQDRLEEPIGDNLGLPEEV